MRWRVLVSAMFVGCASSSPAVEVGAALASAVISRAHGGCVATCTAGTICDEDTGQCERPCGGACRDDEVCTAQDVCAPAIVWTETSSAALGVPSAP